MARPLPIVGQAEKESSADAIKHALVECEIISGASCQKISDLRRVKLSYARNSAALVGLPHQNSSTGFARRFSAGNGRWPLGRGFSPGRFRVAQGLKPPEIARGISIPALKRQAKLISCFGAKALSLWRLHAAGMPFEAQTRREAVPCTSHFKRRGAANLASSRRCS